LKWKTRIFPGAQQTDTTADIQNKKMYGLRPSKAQKVVQSISGKDIDEWRLSRAMAMLANENHRLMKHLHGIKDATTKKSIAQMFRDIAATMYNTYNPYADNMDYLLRWTHKDMPKKRMEDIAKAFEYAKNPMYVETCAPRIHICKHLYPVDTFEVSIAFAGAFVFDRVVIDPILFGTPPLGVPPGEEIEY